MIKSKFKAFNAIYGPCRDRYNIPYKVLYLQLVVSSVTILLLLALATCGFTCV